MLRSDEPKRKAPILLLCDWNSAYKHSRLHERQSAILRHVIANHYARFPGVAILTPHLSLRTSAHAGVAIPRIFRLPKGNARCLLTPSRLRRAAPLHTERGLAIPQSAWHLTAPFTQGSHYSTIQPRLYHARDCHGSLAPQRCAERNRRRRLLARSSAHCLAMTGKGGVRAGSE